MTKAQNWVMNNAKEYNFGEESAFQFAERAYIAGATENGVRWHKLSEKYPEADKLVRVHCCDGMEYICETCYYEPTEDEIGYGKLIINFYELNGEWIDDNDIVAWCEIPQFKEQE